MVPLNHAVHVVLDKRKEQWSNREIKNSKCFILLSTTRYAERNDGWWGVDVEKLLVHVQLNNLMYRTEGDDIATKSWNHIFYLGCIAGWSEMEHTCHRVYMRWTIWEGGLGEQPSSRVRSLLLSAIFSLAGPQQHQDRNLTQSSPSNVCSTFSHTHTHTQPPLSW